MFVVWLDLRTQSTVERLLKRIPGNNKSFFKVRDITDYLNSSWILTATVYNVLWIF